MSLITTNFRGLRRLRPRQRRSLGAAAVEFALTLPIWVLLLLGTTDIAYMMIISQRVDRIAYSVTDIVTQSDVVTQTDLNNILLAAGQLMQPFSFGEDGVVIITSLYKPSGQPTQISWQYTGGGSLSRVSKIGLPGGSAPILPAELTLSDNENLIVAEVYYIFNPMFIQADILDSQDIYRAAIYKPRLSPLVTPPT